MPRTTALAVGGIIDVETGDDVTAHIETANALVTEICEPLLQSDGVTPKHDATRLELIERYLAAHFYASHKPRAQVETVFGAVSETKDRGEFKLFLNNTRYGQHAMVLETTGTLAAYNNALETAKTQLPAGGRNITWLGSCPPTGWTGQ